MVYVSDLKDFKFAAKQMYNNDPHSCRYTMKYIHSKGCLLLKVTDNIKCIQYKAEHTQDLKAIEKFTTEFMNDMACKNN